MSQFVEQENLRAVFALRCATAQYQGRSDWGDRPPKTYESNFIHHDFVQFGKTTFMK